MIVLDLLFSCISILSLLGSILLLIYLVATVTSAPRFSDSVRETLQNSNTGIMVSIIVPARNEEQGITKCLDSLVNQTYPNLEIIVVDDSSTDKTFENSQNHSKRKINESDWFPLARNQRDGLEKVGRAGGDMNSVAESTCYL